MAGDGTKPVGGAEPDGDEPDAFVFPVPVSPVHLDQVLLAGQSVAVAQQDDHLDAGEGPEEHVGTSCLVEGNASDVDGDVLGGWHVVSSGQTRAGAVRVSDGVGAGGRSG